MSNIVTIDEESVYINGVRVGGTEHQLYTIVKTAFDCIDDEDEEVLALLNRHGAKYKSWLPPSYGSKTYKDMSDEEKLVVDEFEGREAYEAAYAMGKALNNSGGLMLALS